MTTLSIKDRLIKTSITHLEQIAKDLREVAKYNMRGDNSTDEGGFSGNYGDYSAQSTDNQSKERALRSRADAEKHENMIELLKRQMPAPATDTIQLMSLVETNHGSFLISYALRPIELDGVKYTFLATDAPIYAEMAGKKAGDSFSFRGVDYNILSVS